jgi:hypothetical protein
MHRYGLQLVLFSSCCVGGPCALPGIRQDTEIPLKITGVHSQTNTLTVQSKKWLQLVSSPLQLGKKTQATVYTNPLFYYSIKVLEQ